MLNRRSRRKLPSAVFCWIVVGSTVSAGCYYSKGQRDALDIPLAPTVGHVRSPEFQTRLPYMYDIGIGMKPATPVARCIAAAPPAAKQIAQQRGCAALAPPLGGVQWVVTDAGRVVARGSSRAFSWEWPRNAAEAALYTRSVGGLMAERDHRYVLELEIEPAALDLAQFQPRLQVRYLGM